MRATPVYFMIDSETYPVVNITQLAKKKGMKGSQSDVDTLFSVTGLDDKKTHTWMMHDYDDGSNQEKFLSLYRLTSVYSQLFHF